jgi:hypothetical protein
MSGLIRIRPPLKSFWSGDPKAAPTNRVNASGTLRRQPPSTLTLVLGQSLRQQSLSVAREAIDHRVEALKL